MKILLKSLIGVGVFLLIGTAGASDFGRISFKQMLLQIFISITLFVLGYFGLEFIKVRQKRVIKI